MLKINPYNILNQQKSVVFCRNSAKFQLSYPVSKDVFVKTDKKEQGFPEFSSPRDAEKYTKETFGIKEVDYGNNLKVLQEKC